MQTKNILCCTIRSLILRWPQWRQYHCLIIIPLDFTEVYLTANIFFFFFFFWKCIMSIMIKDLLIWYQLIISSEGLVNLLCTNVYLNTTFCNILLVVGSGAGYKIFKNTNITNKLFLNTILQTQLQPAHIFSSFFISFSKRHNKSI